MSNSLLKTFYKQLKNKSTKFSSIDVSEGRFIIDFINNELAGDTKLQISKTSDTNSEGLRIDNFLFKSYDNTEGEIYIPKSDFIAFTKSKSENENNTEITNSESKDENNIAGLIAGTVNFGCTEDEINYNNIKISQEENISINVPRLKDDKLIIKTTANKIVSSDYNSEKENLFSLDLIEDVDNNDGTSLIPENEEESVNINCLDLSDTAIDVNEDNIIDFKYQDNSNTEFNIALGYTYSNSEIYETSSNLNEITKKYKAGENIVLQKNANILNLKYKYNDYNDSYYDKKNNIYFSNSDKNDKFIFIEKGDRLLTISEFIEEYNKNKSEDNPEINADHIYLETSDLFCKKEGIKFKNPGNINDTIDYYYYRNFKLFKYDTNHFSLYENNNFGVRQQEDIETSKGSLPVNQRSLLNALFVLESDETEESKNFNLEPGETLETVFSEKVKLLISKKTPSNNFEFDDSDLILDDFLEDCNVKLIRPSLIINKINNGNFPFLSGTFIDNYISNFSVYIRNIKRGDDEIKFYSSIQRGISIDLNDSSRYLKKYNGIEEGNSIFYDSILQLARNEVGNINDYKIEYEEWGEDNCMFKVDTNSNTIIIYVNEIEEE